MKIIKLKSGIYKKILGVFGAAGFLVTFQACYGTPQNFVNVQGSVKDKDTNESVGALQVSLYSETDSVCVTTDENGKFDQSLIAYNNIKITIVDIDGTVNGSFSNYDTIIPNTDHIIEIDLPKN